MRDDAAEQAPSQDLEAGQAGRVAVQRVDGALGGGDGGRDIRGDGKLHVRDRIGNERLVAERPAFGPPAGDGRISGPGEGLVAAHRKRNFTKADW
jgi:hypothetical protein